MRMISLGPFEGNAWLLGRRVERILSEWKEPPGSRWSPSPSPPPTKSQKAEILEYAAEHGVAPAAAKFGVSRFSIYGWHKQVEKAAAGEAPSPTSGPAPADIEAQRDREILAERRRHPGLGPSQIVNQLRRIGIKLSVNTAGFSGEEGAARLLQGRAPAARPLSCG